MVLAMVLAEDVLMLLLMIEQLECKPTTTMAMAIARQQLQTLSDVVAERGPAVNNGYHKMGQQGKRPCLTPGTIQ